MTASHAAALNSGGALVAYLSQRDASAAICNARAAGPHISALDDDGRAALVSGLVEGNIEPTLWRKCVNAIAGDGAAARSLNDAIATGYERLLRDPSIETSEALQARLKTMHQFYVERETVADGHAGVVAPLFAELREALAEHRLGPFATKMGGDLIAVADLARGRWEGHAVDLAAIDWLYVAGDEARLRLFADRLPAPNLREEAERRLVRLHVAASPFPEVRGDAASVEALVMKQGTNPVSLAHHLPARGWLDAQKAPMRGVLVRQHVWEQRATLFGYVGDGSGLSVLPELALRGALMVEAEGVSRPITLCGPPRALDPSPCIDPRDVHLDNPAAYLDAGGAFHFVDELSMPEVVKLTEMGARFKLPVLVGERLLLTPEWAFTYERPEDMVFQGAGRGPDLAVAVNHRDPARFVFAVSDGTLSRLAVVEARDVLSFRVVSRDQSGSSGSPGSPGYSGSMGGQCQSGGAGGAGHMGGPGRSGTDGGDLAVQIDCAGAPCDDIVPVLARVILSEGGAGGAGGPGGMGGLGGMGGSSRPSRSHTGTNGITVMDDPGCSSGSSGPSGSTGASGPSGSRGSPGSVSFSIVR